jgi:predicted N-formylglutamate amidohydrolase
MWQHATQRTLPHALIEVRNDLIATEAGQRDWATRLAPHIEGAFAQSQ